MRGGLILFFLSALIFTGCSQIVKKEQPTGASSLLEPQTVSKFSDVPVPVGFKLLPQASYSFENSGLRVGLLKYEGKADVEHVVDFYKEQMAMYNWRLLNVIEYGERLMNFDREGETCIVSLLAKGRSITITIAFGPKAQTAAKKPVK